MKKFKIIFTFFYIIIFISSANASVIKKNIADKYFNIFSKPILSIEDIKRYQIIMYN